MFLLRGLMSWENESEMARITPGVEPANVGDLESTAEEKDDRSRSAGNSGEMADNTDECLEDEGESDEAEYYAELWDDDDMTGDDTYQRLPRTDHEIPPWEIYKTMLEEDNKERLEKEKLEREEAVMKGEADDEISSTTTTTWNPKSDSLLPIYPGWSLIISTPSFRLKI